MTLCVWFHDSQNENSQSAYAKSIHPFNLHIEHIHFLYSQESVNMWLYCHHKGLHTVCVNLALSILIGESHTLLNCKGRMVWTQLLPNTWKRTPWLYVVYDVPVFCDGAFWNWELWQTFHHFPFLPSSLLHVIFHWFSHHSSFFLHLKLWVSEVNIQFGSYTALILWRCYEHAVFSSCGLPNIQCFNHTPWCFTLM